MKDRFLLFSRGEEDNDIYMLLSNFKFNTKIKPDYTHNVNKIDEVSKFFEKGIKRFKMRFDFHSGHIIRNDEFYNYMDNIDEDYKNSNAKALERIVFSDLIEDNKVNIIYTGVKNDDDKIVRTNIYFIVPANIVTPELNSNLLLLDLTSMNKRLNDIHRSEMTNQKLLGLKPSMTSINIMDRQNKVIDEYFKDIYEYNFINDFSRTKN